MSSAEPPDTQQPGPPDSPIGPTTRRVRRRLTLQPRAILTIAIVWVLLWDRVSWGNFINGLAVGLLVTLAFPLPSIEYRGYPRPHRVLWVAVRFLTDLVPASIQVILLVFSRRPFQNAVVEVGLRSRSDFYLTITAELTTLTPGSLVVDVRRSTSTLYVHLLDVGKPGGIERNVERVLAVEERVVRAIGSREEIAELERRKREDGDR